MARNGGGGPGGGAARLAAALAGVAIAACLAPAPGLAQALGGHGSLDSATPLEVADDGGSDALEVAEDATPEVAAEGPVVATAQDISGTIGSATYTYDGEAKRLSVSGGTFTKNEWNAAIESIKNSVEHIEFTDTAITGDASSMFSGFTSVTTIDASGLNVADVTDMSQMFYDCYGLTSLDDLSGWATGKVTDMSYMFYDCYGLTSLDGLSGWNTGNVTNMYQMFYGCEGLTSLDLSNWSTGSVTYMSSMFHGCSKLTSLEGLSGWDTGNVEYMDNMFYGCSGLTSLDLSNWSTGSVTYMSNMFSGCASLASLDLSGWDTGSVTSMYQMFSGCSELTSLDLSGWDTGSVTDMSCMFLDCSSLTTIAVCGWDMKNVYYLVFGDIVLDGAENMFKGCTSLVGGNGTAFDATKVDRTYARVDGGESDPGYFTGKPAFRGCSLVLSGTIGVTFTLEAPQHFDAAGAYVEFTVGGRGAGRVDLSGLTPVDNKYSVSCGVTSLEMADEVKATLHWNGEAKAGTATASYSVERYADYVVSHDSTFNDKMVRLAKAINDYGYYAQRWLSVENGFGLGAGGKFAAMKEPYKKTYNYDDVKTSAGTYAITKDFGTTGVGASYRLHLDSGTGISVLVRPGSGALAEPSGTLQPSPGSGDVAKQADVMQQSDGSWVLRLDGIPAHRLADTFEVRGTAGDAPFSVDVCALSYVWTVFNSEDLSKQQSKLDALAAFLEYYKASIEYSQGATA